MCVISQNGLNVKIIVLAWLTKGAVRRGCQQPGEQHDRFCGRTTACPPCHAGIHCALCKKWPWWLRCMGSKPQANCHSLSDGSKAEKNTKPPFPRGIRQSCSGEFLTLESFHHENAEIFFSVENYYFENGVILFVHNASVKLPSVNLWNECVIHFMLF